MQKEIVILSGISVGVIEELISNVTQSVRMGERIGIIGLNGSGKTTLLRTIAHLEEPLMGSLSVRGSVEYVPQVRIPAGVSGGEQSLGILERSIRKKPDVLLLDEPTNHLDYHARQRLTSLIKGFRGSVICVSHDPVFLEQVVTKLWIIDHGTIRVFSGTYREYQEERALLEDSLERQREVVRKEERQLKQARAREHARSERSGAFGRAMKSDRSTSRGAQGYFAEHAAKAAARIKKMLDRKQSSLQSASQLLSHKDSRKAASGTFETSGVTGTIVSVQDATLYVLDRALSSGITFSVAHGERVALIGRNGSGKSALAKALQRISGFRLDPAPYVSSSLRSEYLDQHYAIVDPDVSVLENVMQYGKVDRERARQHLAHFLFPETRDVEKKAGSLSGGMTARLALVMLTVSPIDLLILDEPTNNLDMETVDAVIDILNQYQGALLVVSHDADVLERLDMRRALVMGQKMRAYELSASEDLHDILSS